MSISTFIILPGHALLFMNIHQTMSPLTSRTLHMLIFPKKNDYTLQHIVFFHVLNLAKTLFIKNINQKFVIGY